ncbi:MAG: hypothetical protein ACLPOO_19565 [Terriglobales bacterium]
MRLPGRIEKLENQSGDNEVVLEMQDGSIFRYDGTVLEFFAEACRQGGSGELVRKSKLAVGGDRIAEFVAAVFSHEPGEAEVIH